MHITRGQESLWGLENWLDKNPRASDYYRVLARNLGDEFRGVLPK